MTRKIRQRLRRVPPHEDLDFLPSENDGPTALDVLFRRGSFSGHNEGTGRYWTEIRVQRPTYRDGNREERFEIAKLIMYYIWTSNGRFHRKDPDSGCWFVLPPRIALQKVMQDLRS
jgi:hypothetical protein